MQTNPLFTSPSRIQVFNGFLKVPGSRGLGTQDLIIREQTAAKYFKFYSKWQQSMSLLGPHDTFASCWLQNDTFANLVIEAAKDLGIDNLTDLKLSQISELFVSCKVPEGSDELPIGLLFRLHQDFPKLTGAPQETKTPPAQTLEKNPSTCVRSFLDPLIPWVRSLTESLLRLVS